ncbi:BppU family phage baseplate upper protein [Bacillus altitudinis]|uniref:BppU family phage baseplate upper protein n=1 Tax=Bacillus altitudinis TaxID=293387 RepID=UPI0032EDEC8C
MSNQIFKNGVLPFIVNAYDQSVYDSKIVFSTQDVGTARLIFKLRKDGVSLPLSAVEGKLVLLFSNGSKHIRNISLLDKVEGIAEYILKNEEIKLYGNVQASLNLFYSNGQSLSVHEFTFSIKKNLIDENIVPAAEYYIDHFDSLKSKIEQKSAKLEAEIKKRTDVMQGNIDETTKDLQVQLDRMKEKLDDLDSLETKKGAQDKADTALKTAITAAKEKANQALSDAQKYTDELSQKVLTLTDFDSTWTRPTLQHGWKQYVPSDGAINTVRFSKDVAGVVEIKGAVSGGLLGLETPVFTLPEGYRPMQSEYFIGVASSVGTPGVPQYHRTFIGTDGRVCIEYSSNTTNPNRFLAFGFQFRIK